MNKYNCEIILNLNCCGYTGQDVQEILPDFRTEYRTSIGLTWEPCALGPNTFFISIILASTIGGITQGFLSELGKDLYKWTKGKLFKLFKNKSAPLGSITISWKNITILIYDIGSQRDLLKVFSKLEIIREEALKKLPQKKLSISCTNIKTNLITRVTKLKFTEFKKSTK